ncbi:MAG: hypothetical protein OFPI_02790 [Osedax symbiont Rs2]|nr:MAG: hypothetical protein OFPI_02790 [Osedax symbiont Rs2]
MRAIAEDFCASRISINNSAVMTPIYSYSDGTGLQNSFE